MSRLAPVTAVVAIAAVFDGLLAGASLDQSLKQLPARHKLGLRAFSAYSQAADLSAGIAWYAALGLGGALFTLAAVLIAHRRNAPARQQRVLGFAGALAIAHSLLTARAAPVNFSQRAAANDEPALRAIFDRFERLQAARAALQLATFVAMVRALATPAE